MEWTDSCRNGHPDRPEHAAALFAAVDARRALEEPAPADPWAELRSAVSWAASRLDFYGNDPSWLLEAFAAVEAARSGGQK